MPTKNDFQDIVENVKLLLAELKKVRARGLSFLILHRFRDPGAICAPGEEIVGVYLMHRGRQYLVPLSCSLLLLFDYLAHHSHLPQTTSQIFAGMKADPFYRKHGANATAQGRLTRKMSRSCLREYIKRIRMALGGTLRDAGLNLSPLRVLASERTSSNQAAYRLRANFDWIHIDLSTDL